MIVLLNGGVPLAGDDYEYLDKLKENIASEELVTVPIGGETDWDWTHRCLEEASAIVLVCGVCMDGVPSHVLRFLEEIERAVIGGESIPGKFYAILHTDLYEGEQIAAAMGILKNFCRRANIMWGRGLGIGGSCVKPGKKPTLFSLLWQGCCGGLHTDVSIMEHAMFIREQMQGKDDYISSACVSRSNYMRYVNRAGRKRHA
ncbi:MAG: hypothetical protein NC337_11695 [Roseburia sp.]|nr:hypothetical protein [Roseburia sp.]